MKRNASQVLATAGALLCLTLASASAATYTFEDLLTEPNTYRNGSDVTGGYVSGSANFSNSYSDGYWSGFAFSNTTDVITPGFNNQYSAYTGGGAGGSSSYAVAYVFSIPTISFSSDVNLSGLGGSFTNTTYAALVILNGDLDFGTEAFTAGDWFKLTITGSLDGSTTGSVDFYLADYRDGTSLVNDWQYVDFTSLGTVDQLQFNLSSSDNSVFDGISYMNTPAYFAMDNLLAVPEPGTLVLAFVGGLGLLTRRRR